MKKEFCNYEQSLALKELGFDEECLCWYTQSGRLIAELNPNPSYFVVNEICQAPLIQQAFRFLREKYGLHHMIAYRETTVKIYEYAVFKEISDDGNLNFGNNKTYQEAEQACLDKLIEIAKESKQ